MRTNPSAIKKGDGGQRHTMSLYGES